MITHTILYLISENFACSCIMWSVANYCYCNKTDFRGVQNAHFSVCRLWWTYFPWIVTETQNKV